MKLLQFSRVRERELFSQDERLKILAALIQELMQDTDDMTIQEGYEMALTVWKNGFKKIDERLLDRLSSSLLKDSSLDIKEEAKKLAIDLGQENPKIDLTISSLITEFSIELTKSCTGLSIKQAERSVILRVRHLLIAIYRGFEWESKEKDS
jgi:transcriptional regulator of heat shock response